ncbi:MAG TPA: hypothetical protein VLB68_30740 [Pyrinomonadaceae bacterium]|nr:hypothetical protein [Pyrinomonadaceae bacterium]
MTTKLAIKYGMIIAIGVMAWVIVTHVLVPNLNSPLHSIGTVTFFNLLQFVSIYLGLKELERIRKEKVSFKEGIKTGVAISFVYAIAASIFFSGALLLIGPQFMAGDQMAAPQSTTWKVALQAFAGLGIGAMFFGLIYSTLISFFLAKRSSSES